MTYPVGEWTFNPEGYPPGSALFYGPVLFPAGIDPETTQTVTCVFGPAGGRVNVPPVFDGQPGQPPMLTVGTVDTISVGGDATFTLTQTSPGGSGTSSAYTVDVGIPVGATGAAAANTLISPQPSDLEGTPTAKQMIGYDAGTSKAQWQNIPFSFAYNVTGIAATGAGAGPTRSLTSITIPGQATAYIPLFFTKAVITGTANTQVDVVVRMGGTINTTSGSQVARGWGPIGAVTGTNPWPVTATPDFTSLITGGYGRVAASTAETFYLNCEQQASTTDLYSTGIASLTVAGIAVP